MAAIVRPPGPRSLLPVLSKILGGLGRTLITAGVLILAFVAYQLWGTGLHEAAAQRELGSEFEELLAGIDDAPAEAPSTETTATPTTEPDPDAPVDVEEIDPVAPGLEVPEHGAPVAQIRMPDIGVDRTVVSGDDLENLKRGPGHDRRSPLPGQAGNVAIAGHRTTYGQPFHNFDKVELGDQILFTTVQGEFVYEVTDKHVVLPHEVEILDDFGDNRVTLIACEPKYSAAKRLIIVGTLVGQPKAPLPGQEEARAEVAQSSDVQTLDGGAGTEPVSRTPVYLWGLAAAAVWMVTWLGQVALRRRMRTHAEADGTSPTRAQRLLTWSPYVVGFPVFVVVLYVFFERFALLLPASY